MPAHVVEFLMASYPIAFCAAFNAISAHAARAAHAALATALAFGLGLPGHAAAAHPAAGPSLPSSSTYSVLIEEMRQPDARASGMDDTDKVETGTRPLLGAIDWGGRRFLHYGHRTYWTADEGRTWRSQGWMEPGLKPPRLWLPLGRFRATGTELYLVSGEGAAAAAAFDTLRDEWVRVDFGRTGRDAFTALGYDVDAVYLYDITRQLTRSRDGGVSWQRVASVAPPEGASFYEDIEAEGPAILLRFNRPYGIATDAASSDGGATWRFLPAGADAHLFEGCFHFAADGMLRSECGPGKTDRIASAPFSRLVRLFRQEGGGLFALGDSALFLFRPSGSGGEPGGGAGMVGSWEPVAGFGRDSGWIAAGGMLARQSAQRVMWVSSARPDGVSIRIGSGRRGRLEQGRQEGFPGAGVWMRRGVRADGRSFDKLE